MVTIPVNLGPVRTAVPEWPVGALDVPELLRRGVWRPVPFQEFVVKVHSRCNLACDYCYMYEMADQGWRDQPRVMAPEVMARVAARIAEHAHAHELPVVKVVLHGGEPLLAGPVGLRRFVGMVREAVEPRSAVRFAVQTNGVLLDERHLPVLLEHGVRIGVSVDGGRADNDRHRRFPNGRGSFDAVAEGIGRLTQEPYRRLFSGILCTIDLENDPVETYQALLGFGPPALNFLLPHGNWSSPPPGRTAGAATPYADWLIAVFDAWCASHRRPTRIRMFESIVSLVAGGTTAQEDLGLAPVSLLVVETDGTFEQVDSLKSTFDGAAGTGASVWSHSLDDVLRHPGVVARQIGAEALCQTCRACPIQRVCGGGLYTHRYRAGHGFLNPSVYCADLAKLIRHVTERLLVDLRQRVGA
ncbi:MAG: uncharacterized protein V7603_2210 [Micromonosporaceae bacterium]